MGLSFAMVFACVWDDGYPNGGNYWSDSNGTDMFSGSIQMRRATIGLETPNTSTRTTPTNIR